MLKKAPAVNDPLPSVMLPVSCRSMFEMSGGWRQSKIVGRRPLDGRVGRHFSGALGPRFPVCLAHSLLWRRARTGLGSSDAESVGQSSGSCEISVSSGAMSFCMSSTHKTFTPIFWNDFVSTSSARLRRIAVFSSSFGAAELRGSTA